jgi:HD-GYP domain-containing protein (c-di-GMP phosphodiesterase class II)
MAIFTERKIKTSILVTLTLMFFCIGVIPLLISNWKLILINRTELQNNLKESFVATASNVSSRIGSYVSEYSAQIGEFAQNASADITQMDQARSQSELPNLMKDSNIIKVRAYNRAGKFRYAQRLNFQDARVAEKEREAFNHALRGESYIGRPYYDRADEIIVLILAEPVRDSADRILGAVTVVLSGEPLWKILQEESAGGTKIYVVDSQGNLLLHQQRVLMKEERNLRDSAIVRDYLLTRGRVSTVRVFEEKQGERTTEIIGSYASIAPLKWGVIIQVDKNIAFASVKAMIQESMKWGVLFALAAAVLGFFLARWITTPIQILAQHALNIGRHQNFDQKIEIKASNEIQQLADTFNFMTDEIKQNILGLQAAAQENKELFMSSIRMLAAAIDAKDPYTRGHSERVKEYSLIIGRVISFSTIEMERLEIAALLHDVGKIGIDDRILRKPTNLTPEEFEIMKTHPDKGAMILAQIAQLKDIIPGMRSHHENWDGTGYPLGLKGTEIPIFGRVITVADTFDAMTTDRPYQKAFTLEFALDRIRTMSTVKYDPDIVVAFAGACQSGKVALQKPARPRPAQPVV